MTDKAVVDAQNGVGRRDNDGLHKRRGIWHYKLKVDGSWKEISTRTSGSLQVTGRPQWLASSVRDLTDTRSF
jgi:hypothetical protein